MQSPLQTKAGAAARLPHRFAVDPWLCKTTVAAWLDISTVTLDRMVRHGEFPPPIRVGRLMRWRESVVRQHLANLEAAARQGGVAHAAS